MDTTNHIRAVTFDADDTLWDYQKAMRQALAVVLPRMHAAAPAAASITLEDMLRFREEVAAQAAPGRLTLLDLEAIRLRSFERALESVGCNDAGLARDLFTEYVDRRFEAIEPFPDVLPALNVLRSRFPVGVLTNGNTRLERLRHALPFDFAVYATDHGVGKPDPRIFEIAARRAGCATHQLLHVGDSLEDDVAGAIRSGASPVWLSRSGGALPTDFASAPVIRSLSELPFLLNQPA